MQDIVKLERAQCIGKVNSEERLAPEAFFRHLYCRDINSLGVVCQLNSFLFCAECFDAEDWPKDFLSPYLHGCVDISYDGRFYKESFLQVLQIIRNVGAEKPRDWGKGKINESESWN